MELGREAVSRAAASWPPHWTAGVMHTADSEAIAAWELPSIAHTSSKNCPGRVRRVVGSRLQLRLAGATPRVCLPVHVALTLRSCVPTSTRTGRPPNLEYPRHCVLQPLRLHPVSLPHLDHPPIQLNCPLPLRPHPCLQLIRPKSRPPPFPPTCLLALPLTVSFRPATPFALLLTLLMLPVMPCKRTQDQTSKASRSRESLLAP